MDPIQQRLQAVYQQKSESDIDRKLKSASTTVLDQRITFHDASKVTTCPNSQLKGKYLFMKPSTNMQTMKPSTITQTVKPNCNSVPVHTAKPVKKDSDSKNNNAAKTSPIRDNDHQHVQSERNSPCTKISRSRSPLSRKSRSRSPLTRKSRSRSPLSRKSRIRSPLTRKSRSRSPLSRKSRSRSPLSRKSRSRSPLTRKSRSRSPLPRKSRSRSLPKRKSKSRSPLARKSPLSIKSRSRSPVASKFRSRSPLTRKSRSRSPLTRKSRSRSPLTRKYRSRSPLTRKDSESPCLWKDGNGEAENWKRNEKKRKKKTYLTPFYVDEAESETEVDGRLEVHVSTGKASKEATISILPYFNLAQSDKTHKEKIPVFKNKIDTFEKVEIPPSWKESSVNTKRKETQMIKIEKKRKTVKSNENVEKKGKVIKNKHEKIGKMIKKKHKMIGQMEKNNSKKQHSKQSRDSSETTDKIKETRPLLLPGEAVESSLVSEPGTSSGSGVETTVGRIERRENNPEESGSEREVVETFDWVDFRKYLPDTFDDLFLPQEDGDNMPRPNTVLFPEHRLDYSWKFPEGGCGLINRGNTCFVNAALQCLTYCPPFVNYLLSGQHAQDCRMMKKDRCILCSFTRYLHESLKMINKHNLVPNWFLNNLYCVAKHFSIGRQEDSHEYLRLSLEQMQKVCLVGHNQLDRYSKETTVVNQIFGGFLRSQVVCLKCKAKSNTYDPFLDLSLDIRTCNTLERAFEIFVHPEKLDIENAYKCANCKHKVEALKRFTIHKAPNILTVQLKRFQATHDDKFGGHFRGVKINKAIKFPPRLNIRGYMSVRNGPPELYSLYALLFHEGHSANSGHYTCTVKSGNKWFHISDGSKIRTSLHTVDLQDVYVLFYMREDKQRNGIIQNPALKTDNNKGKEFKEAQRQPSFSSPSGGQRPSMSGVQKMSPSGTPKLIGPVKPKIIHNNEFQFKPVKTNTNSGIPGNDIGSPVKRKDMSVTPQKPDTIKVPFAADRNKVSFGIKTPGKAHPPSLNSSIEKSTSHTTNSQMSKSHSEPALGSAKPRIVMQIKNGRATTIEKSPDGQKKILSDDEEVMGRMSEKKAHKKVRKSVLVPYGNESSSDSDTDLKQSKEVKVKRERKEDSNNVVFDTKLNTTTSVPGNIHLMKGISSHVVNGEANMHKEKAERVEKMETKTANVAELNRSTDSIHSERHGKHAHSIHEEKQPFDKPAKSEVNISNNCHPNHNGHHVYMKHPNGGIHIYDSEPTEHKPEVKHHTDVKPEDKHHSHNNVKKRKLIEDARIDIVNGEFHVVSDKKPLLTPTENGQTEKQYKDSEEYRLLKKAKKHKKHKKEKQRHKEQRYETLLNESDSRHQVEEEHHVKKHKKKKRKHKERGGYDIEEEHSYKKRRHEEHGEGRVHKHYHHGETVEGKVHKRQRQESESSSSVEFEWVEKKIDTPVKHSKSAAW